MIYVVDQQGNQHKVIFHNGLAYYQTGQGQYSQVDAFMSAFVMGQQGQKKQLTI